MKISIRNNYCHIETGVYKVRIVACWVRQLGSGRQQLQTINEVLSGEFEGCNFNYCVMLDGSANFYLKRLLAAALPNFNDEEFDTEMLVEKVVVMKIENHRLPDGSANQYPNVVDVQMPGRF